jgi:SAM-dependent methyltransferase
MKQINNVADLDRHIQLVDERFGVSDDEGRRALSEFCYVVDHPLPADPYSPEYYQAQMRLYRDVSGRPDYSIANEHVPMHLDEVKKNPFPYCTKSAATVGDQLIAIGYLIRAMSLPAGSRLVEFGPGWGTTTVTLSQMGYRVTAVDAEPAFIDLIAHRARTLGQQIELVTGDMLGFHAERPYDAALFFECFHHCADHLRMLRQLHDLVADDGLIAFAGEPVADAPHFPFPWGLRLEGMAVWSIRKFGWLELGFDTSYFLRTLLRLGWSPRRHRSDVSHYADVIVARKSRRYYEPGKLSLPPDECITWAGREADPNNGLRFAGEHSVLSCERDIPVEIVELGLGNFAPFDLDVTVTAGTACRTFRLPRCTPRAIYTVPAREWDGRVTIGSKTWQPAQVMKSGDQRILGVAVHHLRLVGAGG